MPSLHRTALAGAAVLAALTGCGEREPKPDNAALDRHFNQIIADEEAERRRLVEEARAREELREREMEQRAENYSETPD